MKYIVEKERIFENEVLKEGRILSSEDNNYRFLYNEKVYSVKLLNFDSNTKTYTIKIDGHIITVQKENELDALIKQLGYDKPPKKIIKEITSPMPGLVKSILIQVGDVIVEGQNLFVLEAMKMENIIKSQGEGVVSSIPVSVGDKIDKGAILAKL